MLATCQILSRNKYKFININLFNPNNPIETYYSHLTDEETEAHRYKVPCQPSAVKVKVQSPNHWTTREFPIESTF